LIEPLWPKYYREGKKWGDWQAKVALAVKKRALLK